MSGVFQGLPFAGGLRELFACGKVPSDDSNNLPVTRSIRPSRFCALRSANLLNKADLARDVGIAPSTANHWLSILEASGQIVLLEPWFSNRMKSIVKSPKLYLADTGLLCALVNIRSEEALRQSPAAAAVWVRESQNGNRIDRMGMCFVGWNEVVAISNPPRGFDEP